jgi:predicted ArsR family transcriptional regulator
MQLTRKSILGYLKNNHLVSAGDLARVLDMTPANIRYHLKILLEHGNIQVSGTRPAGGSGRPIYLYNLSSPSLGENLERLLQSFLINLEKHPDRELIREDIADLIREDHPREKLSRVNLYNRAVEMLNELNYHANWQARPEGPQIELRHCPYRSLALNNSQICMIDQALISNLLETPMTLIQKRSFGDNPYSPCLFNGG